MKKRLTVIAMLVFLGLGFSCEDSFNDISSEEIVEIENSTDDEELEDVLPGERKKKQD